MAQGITRRWGEGSGGGGRENVDATVPRHEWCYFRANGRQELRARGTPRQDCALYGGNRPPQGCTSRES